MKKSAYKLLVKFLTQFIKVADLDEKEELALFEALKIVSKNEAVTEMIEC